MVRYALHWPWSLKGQFGGQDLHLLTVKSSGKLLNFYKPQFSCMKNGIITPQGCSED